ncbi:MAG: hypothetical protein K6A36_03195 [Paludibacteraceae bacterium]|nr:hypothetical protein [Paludibacteraceae bacterium]
MNNLSKFTAVAFAAISLAGCQKNVLETADLRLFDLRGDVKNVKTFCITNVSELGELTDESERFLAEECNYDENGQLIFFIENDGDTAAITRNEAGLIISLSVDCEDDAGIYNEWGFVRSYKWNDLERLTEKSYSKCGQEIEENRILFYNADGQNTRDSVIYHDVTPWYSLTEYSVLKSDKYGNWTKRLVSTESYMLQGNDMNYAIEEREIIYQSDKQPKPQTQSEQIPVVAETQIVYTDLLLCNLTGKVQNVKTFRTLDVDAQGNTTPLSSRFPEATYTFDEDGLLLSRVERDSAVITRDANGHIISFAVECGKGYDEVDDVYEDEGFELGFTWSNSGKPIGEEYNDCIGHHHKRTYTFDVDGQIIGSTGTCSGEGEEWEQNIKYTILTSDQQGNWTKRVLTKENKRAENSVRYAFELEERDITYFE